MSRTRGPLRYPKSDWKLSKTKDTFVFERKYHKGRQFQKYIKLPRDRLRVVDEDKQYLIVENGEKIEEVQE